MEEKSVPIISQYQTVCLKLSETSLQCSIDNKDNLQNCQDHFDVNDKFLCVMKTLLNLSGHRLNHQAYKACRKEENKARRARNRAKTTPTK